MTKEKSATTNPEDFPLFAEVLRSQYVDINSANCSPEQLAVLNNIADTARERVLRIWTEQGMTGRDSDAYFKKIADAIRLKMPGAHGADEKQPPSVVAATVSLPAQIEPTVVDEEAPLATGGDTQGSISPDDSPRYAQDPRGEFLIGQEYTIKNERGEPEEGWNFRGKDGDEGVFVRVESGELVELRSSMAQLWEPESEDQTAATNEPPAAIVAVAEVVQPPADSGAEVAPLSAEAQAEKEAVEKLNAIKKEIDAQYAAIHAIRVGDKDDAASKTKTALVRRTLDKLYLQAKDIVASLVGAEKLFGLVKPADVLATKLYESKIPKSTPREDRKRSEALLSPGVADAHYEAVRRKNSFAEVLGAKGIARGIAYDLYQELSSRAKDVEWLESELLAGNKDVLTGSRARKALEWHGILARQPELVLAAITPIIEEYKTIPPKQERPRRDVPESEKKQRPVEKIFESIAAGQEIEDRTLRAFAKDNRTTNAERERLEAELARRDEAGKLAGSETEKPRKIPPRLARVLDAIKDINGGTENANPPPDELLRKYAHEPEVAAYLLLHPLPPTVRPSSRAIADLIDSGAGAPALPTREERAEIRRAVKGNKAAAAELKKGQLEWGKVDFKGARPYEIVDFSTADHPYFGYKTPLGREILSSNREELEQRIRFYQEEDKKVALASAAETPIAGDEELPAVFRSRRIPTLTDEFGAPPVAAAAPGKSVEAAAFTLLNPAVERQLKEKFGIREEWLGESETFKGLSVGQQLLVLKNLEQMTLSNIKKEAQGAQKKEWKAKPWWGKLLLGASTLGSYSYGRTKGIEKELLAQTRKGWLENDKDRELLAEKLTNIEELAKVAKEGPEVKVNPETGELEIAYVSGKDLFASDEDPAITPAQRVLFAKFNAAATAFAKLPREWGYAPKSEKEKKENALYTEKKAEYGGWRASMLQLYRDRFAEEIAADPARSGENPEKAAILAMNALDERMELNQLFNTHPDAEKALANIESQSAIWEGVKDFWSDKGKYLALGFGLRMGAAIASGGVMAPLIALTVGGGVGGLTGGLQGQNEAKKLIRDRRIDRRMSEEDEREEVSYDVYKTESSPTGGMSYLRDGKGNLVVERTEKRRIKEYTDAMFFVDRIERLRLKLERATDPKERELLERKIAQTTALMEEKYERGLINFGGSSLEEGDTRKGNTIANRLSFMQALGAGHTIEIVDQEKLEAQMARAIGLHQGVITELERKEILKAASWAGGKRMVFALAGGYIAHEAIGWLKEQDIFAGLGFGGATEHAPGANPAVSGVIRHAPIDAPTNSNAFDAENFDKNIPGIIGHTPSLEELEALRSTSGLSDPTQMNMDKHTELILEMKRSPTPLTHEQIAGILGGPKGAVVPGDAGESVLGTLAQEPPGAELPEYHIVAGDNFTKIVKANIPEFKDLSPYGQENAIQNLLKSLSPDERAAIGLGSDPNKLAVGDSLDLNKVLELLHEKKIGGEDLLERAAHLSGPLPTNVILDHGTAAPEGVVGAENVIPRPAGVPLSMEDTAVTWQNLPEEIKLPQAQLEAGRYLTADVERLFPKPLFASVSPEWLSLRDRDALPFFDQMASADPQTLVAGAEKVQRYIVEQGITRGKGYIPVENETLGDFLKRALAEKVLKDGPSRPLVTGRILQ